MSAGEEPVDGLGEDFDFDAAFQREFGPKPPVRSVLVLPAPDARQVTELCALAQVRAHVVPVRGLGCVLVAEDPADGEHGAKALSELLRRVEVILLTVREESIEGQSWTGGERGADPRPGLLLSVWPDAVQQLVLGRLDPAQAATAARDAEGGRTGVLRKLFRKETGREETGREEG